MSSRLVHALVVGSLGLLVAACGASDAAAPEAPVTVGGVGELPGTVASGPTVPATTEPASTESSVPEESTPAASAPPTNDERTAVGRRVEGNRVIVLGDSILASISNRYGDQLCAELVPKGWVVEVDAEVGRSIEFGREVLHQRLADGWDAAVVMLGNNYRGDPQAFGRELDLLLDELAPRPVLLLSVTRFEAAQDEVNYVLISAADQRDDVRLLDWAARTAEGAPDAGELLAGDGLHLSADGQQALAAMISRAMGRPPGGGEGECLRSSFRDDSDGTIPPLAPSTDGGEDASGDDDDRGVDGDRTNRSGGRATTGTTTTPPPARPPASTSSPPPPPPGDDDEPSAHDPPPADDAPTAAAPMAGP